MSPDPISIFLAYLPVVLAVFACLFALSSSALTFGSGALARRFGRPAPETPTHPSNESAPQPA